MAEPNPLTRRAFLSGWSGARSGEHEVTQAEWSSIMGSDPGADGLRVLRGAGQEDSPLWAGLSARHAERPGRRLRWNSIRLARDVR